ncbi:MAG: hypothetical protein IAE80_23565 [Anaerolinea sp.]|nr:hypothetical protein [Anaerolinea sp.]
MIATTQVRISQLRLASHYVELVCRCNVDYLSGFERSLKAIQVFDRERLQIENTVSWLMHLAEDDEVGALLVTLLRDGYQLLYARIEGDELRTWLKPGLNVARRLGDVRSQAVLLLVLAYSLRLTSSPDPSEPYLDQAYALAQQTGDELLLVRCLQAFVKLYRQDQKYDAAARCNQQAYELSCRLGYITGMYEYYQHRGEELYSAGQLEAALAALNEAYALALKAGLYREIALILTKTGMIYHLQERFAEALVVLEQAREFAQCTEFPPVMIFTLYALGDVQAAVKDVSAAQETFLTGLRLAEHHHFDEEAGALSGELGVLAFQQHDLRRAQEILESAVDQLRALESTFYYPTFLTYLIPVRLGLGDVEGAECALREGLDFLAGATGAQESLALVWAAAQLGIHHAGQPGLPPEQQASWAARAARWTGAALTLPSMMPDRCAVLRHLIPDLHARLGVEHTAELLTAGAQLAPDSLIAELGAAFFGQ